MIVNELIEKGRLAKDAAYHLTLASPQEKNKALEKIAGKLIERKDEILRANELDIADAKEKKLPSSLQDRLLLTSQRVEDMAEGLKQLIVLDDPVGEIDRMWRTNEGLEIGKMRVPLGVIGIIYEARPNVTVDAAGLCLKSGNAVILRGGSDAINSNKKIAQIIEEAISDSDLPDKSVQLIEDTSRKVANQMLKLNEYLDVLIPRGGAGLIKNVMENATVPVIETGAGNCHIYVEEDADLEMAKNIVINAKTQRTGVCNAAESLLIHENIGEEFLSIIGPELINLGVEIRCCEKCKQILPKTTNATEEDYATEFLDLIISIKIVKDIDEALEHIRKFGTKHSEAIITNSYEKAKKFQRSVDASSVYVNASTRFSDGFMFGFGAEIGISTQKLHARGPMGLKELTSFKYIINGEGQIRK